MTITKRLMLPGTWGVSLVSATPDSITSEISRLDHIVVTSAPLMPAQGFSDANILDSALYVGVITKTPSATELAGHGLEWWMGTPKGYGVGTSGTQGLLTTAVAQTTATLSTWVTALLPPSLSAGTVTNTGLSTLTNTYQGMTRREALANVCALLGAEFRINTDGSVDAADPDLLFVSTPRVIVTRKPEATDSGLVGLNGSTIMTSTDVDDFFSKAIVVTKGTGAAATATTVTGSSSYKDLLGNTVHVERYIDAPAALAANATTIGNAALAKFNSERRDLTLRSSTYDVTTHVEPGDTIYVWDQVEGLVDANNQVMFCGEPISPLALRVTGLTFPIERGMGVYVRRSSDGSYIDLTDFVAWETGDVSWEVGAPRRKLVGSKAEFSGVSSATLGVNPDIAQRLAGGTPTGYVASTSQTTTAWTNNTATETAITSVGISTALSTSRRYKLVFNGRFSTSVAGDQVIVRFYENGTQRKAALADLIVAGRSYTVHHEWVFTPASASSVTYDVYGARAAGTGNVAAVASATTTIDFWIEDLGPT